MNNCYNIYKQNGVVCVTMTTPCVGGMERGRETERSLPSCIMTIIKLTFWNVKPLVIFKLFPMVIFKLPPMVIFKLPPMVTKWDQYLYLDQAFHSFVERADKTCIQL